MGYERKPLKAETVNILLSQERNTQRFSWLSTINKKLVLEAATSGKTRVTLDRRGWTKFSIEFENNRIYIAPEGKGCPFGPVAYLTVEKLEKDVEYV